MLPHLWKLNMLYTFVLPIYSSPFEYFQLIQPAKRISYKLELKSDMSRLMMKPTKWLCDQRSLRSAWASTQSDQSLCCPHEENLGPQLPIQRIAKSLIKCPGWSLIPVFAGRTVIVLVLSGGCSYMGRIKQIWFLSSMRAAKVQTSLRIRAVSPEPSLLAHTSSESRGTFRQKARPLAPLNGWACAVKIYHDGMLEDTNSLDPPHMGHAIRKCVLCLMRTTNAQSDQRLCCSLLA